MRKIALTLTLGGLCALTSICILGLLTSWYREGTDLVLSGASDVRIDGRGTAHLHITYDLAPDQRLYNVRDHFLQQGWRRVRVQNYEHTGPVFGRRSWFGVIQEVAIVNANPARSSMADISVVRCLRIARWVSCPG